MPRIQVKNLEKKNLKVQLVGRGGWLTSCLPRKKWCWKEKGITKIFPFQIFFKHYHNFFIAYECSFLFSPAEIMNNFPNLSVYKRSSKKMFSEEQAKLGFRYKIHYLIITDCAQCCRFGSALFQLPGSAENSGPYPGKWKS